MPRRVVGDRHLQTTTAPDGRVLTFAEWGDLEGSPVIFLHGTPGCRLSRHPNQELVRSTGAHVVIYDRPGYGGSDRHPGRRISDCVPDVVAIADAMGFDRFAVKGGSGGGPHALAAAALLGDRITRVACSVGLAPHEAFGETWTDGMDPENVKEFGWAASGERTLAAELTREDAAIRERVEIDPANVLGAFELPDSDRAVLAQSDSSEVTREEVDEETRNGVWGWVDDDLAFLQPWGFDLAAIRVPTAVWYGLDDVMTPPAHGQWLATHVPGALVRAQKGGHLGSESAMAELNRWLIDGRPWDRT
jgi:pimeloyl-ACP methyl ester carboxylesterase